MRGRESLPHSVKARGCQVNSQTEGRDISRTIPQECQRAGAGRRIVLFDQTLEGIQTRGDGDQMRIIWTERGETPMIWFIWKRDRISCWVQLIDL